jgi:hypothetical protein
MLCQLLWKKELEEAQRVAGMGGKSNDRPHAAE